MADNFERLSHHDRLFKSYRNHPDPDKTKIGADIENDPSNPIPIYAPDPIEATIISATTPSFFNVVTVVSGTEYSQALPADTRSFLIRTRENATTRFSFTSGGTNTTYIEMPPGSSYEKDNLKLASSTIYFQTNVSGATVEILAWT